MLNHKKVESCKIYKSYYPNPSGTGEEFIMLSRHASGQPEAQPQPVTDTSRKYVYGILGIAKLFGCSLPTANRIKKSGKIDKAITQIGRKIIVDAELALELAGKKTGGRK